MFEKIRGYLQGSPSVFVDESIGVEDYKPIKVISAIFKLTDNLTKGDQLYAFNFPVENGKLLVSKVLISRTKNGEYTINISDPAISSDHGFFEVILGPSNKTVVVSYTDTSTNGTKILTFNDKGKVSTQSIKKNQCVYLKKGHNLIFDSKTKVNRYSLEFVDTIISY